MRAIFNTCMRMASILISGIYNSEREMNALRPPINIILKIERRKLINSTRKTLKLRLLSNPPIDLFYSLVKP